MNSSKSYFKITEKNSPFVIYPPNKSSFSKLGDNYLSFQKRRIFNSSFTKLRLNTPYFQKSVIYASSSEQRDKKFSFLKIRYFNPSFQKLWCKKSLNLKVRLNTLSFRKRRVKHPPFPKRRIETSSSHDQLYMYLWSLIINGVHENCNKLYQYHIKNSMRKC